MDKHYLKMSTEKKRTHDRLIANDDSVVVKSLKKLKHEFTSNKLNKIVQNSLCANDLQNVSEVREYMQSRDTHFSHSIDPKLEVTNQGLSGRCWMFAVLNVIRHDLIRDLQLPYDFEFSESYLSFYEKIEKSNYFLTQFMDLDKIDPTNNPHIRDTLAIGLSEGGLWHSCVNLINKYGLIPKSCFLESVNSYSTDTIDNVVSTKLREFANILVNTDHSKRLNVKSDMMTQVYDLLSKMLGTPPCPDDIIKWSYVPKQDMAELLEIDIQRKQTGTYKTLEIKNEIETTPVEFYKKYVLKSLTDYMSLSHDPRNKFGVYYESFHEDAVIGQEIPGYYNAHMELMVAACITSILNNVPVMFCCDVGHYFNCDESLFDTKCFDYNLVLGSNLDSISKANSLELKESAANHAMVLVGVDLDEHGKPLKWEVENSWGENFFGKSSNDSHHYTMSHDWFQRFVYEVVIYKDMLPRQFTVKYHKSKKSKVILPEYDAML